MALIEIQNLTFTYPGSFEPVFEDLSLRLDTGWRTGLVGRNGRGKTTLLRLLLGDLPHGGALSMPAGADYFPAPVADPSLDALSVMEGQGPGRG